MKNILKEEGLAKQEVMIGMLLVFDADGIKVFTGTLLNEPNRDMGIHDGDEVKVGVFHTDAGPVCAWCDI